MAMTAVVVAVDGHHDDRTFAGMATLAMVAMTVRQDDAAAQGQGQQGQGRGLQKARRGLQVGLQGDPGWTVESSTAVARRR
jgi:hypothetical protein